MLASFTELLPLLERRNACLPAFDIAGGQSDFLLGVLGACQQARCPAVLLVWAPGTSYIGLEACAELVGFFARASSVPVVLHLDHGQDEQLVTQALRLGFRSVMFDGSALPLEDNIRRTRALAELAHAQGACIEGELGQFGQEQLAREGDACLTDPLQAGQFVRQTGVDLLAPAVGNAHGFYRQKPQLRFDLVREIRAQAGVPLSLHGGTGLPMEDIRRCAALGVRKLNVASQLHKDFTDALAGQSLKTHGPYDWRKILDAGRSAIVATVAGYLKELGVEGLV